MLQEFCRGIGIRATDEGIRELIDALSWLPPGHPLENLLREAPDFQNAATLADALLHPQDRAYSVTQLFDLIDKAELTFGRWVRQAPYSPYCGVLANIPRLKHLSAPQQYAAAELFRGTMVRHSMVVYRNDNPDNMLQPSGFFGDAWLDYVPVRMPDTICVQERLPPGAAAVLINQTHTSKDLLMPIDSVEKCLFDAIDGNGSIADIAARALPTSSANLQHEIAASFFERLEQYDQVVFDLSQVNKVSEEIAQMVQIV